MRNNYTGEKPSGSYIRVRWIRAWSYYNIWCAKKKTNKNRHLISYHLISSHLIPSHTISSNTISSHLILSHLPSHLIASTISSHLISSHTISSHLIPSHLISYHLIPFHFIPSHYILSLPSSHLPPFSSLLAYLFLSAPINLHTSSPFEAQSQRHRTLNSTHSKRCGLIKYRIQYERSIEYNMKEA